MNINRFTITLVKGYRRKGLSIEVLILVACVIKELIDAAPTINVDKGRRTIIIKIINNYYGERRPTKKRKKKKETEHKKDSSDNQKNLK